MQTGLKICDLKIKQETKIGFNYKLLYAQLTNSKACS